jgi:hypothetical protein
MPTATDCTDRSVTLRLLGRSTMNADERPSLREAATRIGLAATMALAGTAAGVGWLYLLRDVRVLDVGPVLPDALALERLAGRDAQPLLRILAAFVPAGFAVAFVLRAAAGLGRAGRAVVAGVSAYALLIAAGTASDAVTRSQPAIRYVAAQPARAAVWLPAVILAICAYAMPARPLRRAATHRASAANRAPTQNQASG